MALRPVHAIASLALALVGCSFGPELRTALPQVRDVPVLASLSPQESLGRARSFLASHQYGLAIELFKTVGRDPALEIESLNGLAIAYDGIGRRDLAERYFQKAMALRTDDGRTRRNLAAFYRQSGQDEKRRALLAEAMPQSPEADASQPDPAAPLAAMALAPAAPVGHSKLDLLSPLGTAFRPLLVNAGIPLILSPTPGAGNADPTVACVADDPLADPESDGPMKMLRISIGEVFLVTQPAGTSCAVESDGGTGTEYAAPEPAISNKEYLGRVAAYLDRLNRLQRIADLSLAGRASL